MKNSKIKALFLTFFALLVLPTLQTFDVTQTGMSGVALNTLMANYESVINFYFSSSSAGSLDSTGMFTANSSTLGSNTMEFLDRFGNDLTYTLTGFCYSNDVFVSPAQTNSTSYPGFTFQFTNGNNMVYVYVPISTTTVSASSNDPYRIDLTQGMTPISTFGITASGSAVLSPFNLLNTLNNGLFYTATSTGSVSGACTTVLVSAFYYYSATALPGTLSNQSPFSMIKTMTWDYANSGSLIGWASSAGGAFQTHMRESYPLWTCVIGIFIYWIYYLAAEPNTMECYDKHFEQNSLTCWGCYSLHYLGHEEYFTRLSRTTIMLMNWCIQGVFLAAMYSSQPTLGPAMIIWTSVIAFVATLPFPYLWGGLFLRKIYNATVHKYQVMRKMKGIFNKESIASYEKEVDHDEQKIYGYFFWYYIIAFVVFVVSWVVAINRMQQLTRSQYYNHWYWIASVFITFALDNIIFDPIFAKCLGHTSFYRMRGYFYDFRLGDSFKQVQL